MKTTHDSLTDEQLDGLIARVESTPFVSEDAHVSDDDLLVYVAELMDEKEARWIDDHIKQCTACGEERDALQSNPSLWFGAEGKERLARLYESLRETNAGEAGETLGSVNSLRSDAITTEAGKSGASVAQPSGDAGGWSRTLKKVWKKLGQQLAAIHGSVPVPGLLAAAAPVAPKEVRPGHGLFGMQWRYDTRNNLIISVSSPLPGLNRMPVRFWVSDGQEWNAAFEQEGDQVLARLRLTPAERAQIPEGRKVHFEILFDRAPA